MGDRRVQQYRNAAIAQAGYAGLAGAAGWANSAMNTYNAARNAESAGNAIRNGVRYVRDQLRGDDRDRAVQQARDRQPNRDPHQDQTSQAERPPADIPDQAMPNADSQESPIGGAAGGSMNGTTVWDQSTIPSYDHSRHDGPYMQTMNTEMVFGHSPVGVLQQFMFPFIWSRRMKREFKNRVYNVSRTYDAFTTYSLKPCLMRIHNLVNYTVNTISQGVDTVTTKSNNNYAIMTSFNQKTAQALTATITDNTFSPCRLEMDQKLVSVLYTELVRDDPDRGSTDNGFDKDEGGFLNQWFKGLVKEPREWIEDEANAYEENNVIFKLREYDASTEIDYRKINCMSDLGHQEARMNNYSTANKQYGSDRFENIFYGKTDKAENNNSNQEIRAKYRPGMQMNIDSVNPVEFKIPETPARMPIQGYYYKVLWDKDRNLILKAQVERNSTPFPKVNYQYYKQDGTPFTQATNVGSAVFLLRPWDFALYISDVRVPNDATEEDIAQLFIYGRWVCQDYGSLHNPWSTNVNQFQTAFDKNGPSREYNFFNNSIQLDNQGRVIQESISAIMEISCGIEFHKPYNEIYKANAVDDYGSATSEGALNTQDAKIHLLPLRMWTCEDGDQIGKQSRQGSDGVAIESLSTQFKLAIAM